MQFLFFKNFYVRLLVLIFGAPFFCLTFSNSIAYTFWGFCYIITLPCKLLHFIPFFNHFSQKCGAAFWSGPFLSFSGPFPCLLFLIAESWTEEWSLRTAGYFGFKSRKLRCSDVSAFKITDRFQIPFLFFRLLLNVQNVSHLTLR